MRETEKAEAVLYSTRVNKSIRRPGFVCRQRMFSVLELRRRSALIALWVISTAVSDDLSDSTTTIRVRCNMFGLLFFRFWLSN